VVISRVLIWQEIGGWLSEAVLAECLIQEIVDMLAVESLEKIFLALYLLLNSLGKSLLHG
jgi:hypothetical protein